MSLRALSHIYGKLLYAVADARVVAAVDGLPDSPVGALPGVLEQADGNHVGLDLGHGRFALYAHLKPHPVRVREGQRARRGDLLGLVTARRATRRNRIRTSRSATIRRSRRTGCRTAITVFIGFSLSFLRFWAFEAPGDWTRRSLGALVIMLVPSCAQIGMVALDRARSLVRTQQRNAATRTMPSSTAARVAGSASSTRAFFSLISTSVAAPTLISATPPASLATRSCSFSLS
jgi:hypothetical protein